MKKRKYTKPRINTFFVEIIIVILFFSIAATIIVEVFATTNYDICVNQIKSHAIINARSIADLYSANINVPENLVRVFGEDCTILTDEKEDIYVIMLNKELTNEGDKKPVTLTVTSKEEDNEAGCYGTIDMTYVYQDEIVYSIESNSYIPSNGEK